MRIWKHRQTSSTLLLKARRLPPPIVAQSFTPLLPPFAHIFLNLPGLPGCEIF
jgi:hypothetical protein